MTLIFIILFLLGGAGTFYFGKKNKVPFMVGSILLAAFSFIMLLLTWMLLGGID